MNTWEDTLKTLFGKFGNMVKCKHLYNKQVAFIEYTEHSAAAKALAATNGTDLDGACIEVQFSGDKPQPGGATSGAAGESKTVFCGNLGFRTTEDTIRQFFEQCGEVATVRIAKNPEDDRPRGFCHIEFIDPASASKAVAELNGYEIEGRAVRLDLSAEK